MRDIVAERPGFRGYGGPTTRTPAEWWAAHLEQWEDYLAGRLRWERHNTRNPGDVEARAERSRQQRRNRAG